MDILEMPKEDYSGMEEAAVFGEKYEKSGLSLSIEHMSYSYHTGTKVFSDASMYAHPHEIVALVGPSGEGKTTMLRLILAVLRPQEGRVAVVGGEGYERRIEDGKKILFQKVSGRKGEALTSAPYTRRFFSYVPQGNTMFSGTIAENMRTVRPKASEDEIISALKKACAYEFVEKLPDPVIDT